MSLADSYSAGRHFYARPPLVHTLSPWSSLGPSETGSLGKVLVSPKPKDFAGCWGHSKFYPSVAVYSWGQTAARFHLPLLRSYHLLYAC